MKSRACSDGLIPFLRQKCHAKAQAIRRSLLRGLRVLIVMLGYSGEPIRRDYFERLHALGLDVVLLDSANHITLARELFADGIIKGRIVAELSDDVRTWSDILEKVRRNGHFAGVMTFVEFGLPLTAWLAEKLNLPGNPYEVVVLGRDKVAVREATARLGIPTPRYSRLTSADDLTAAGTQVGFPAILKPASGLTGIEVHPILSQNGLTRCFNTVMQHINEGIHLNQGLFEMVFRNGPDLILEEFIEGLEFDIDFLLQDGELVYAAVTDNETQPLHPCILIAANMPTSLGEVDCQILIRAVVDWTTRLGYTDGVFHVEAKIRPDGQPVLLEINARLGGASQYQLNKAVWNVDLLEEHVLNCVGIPIRPKASATPAKAYATSYLPSPKSGVVRSAEFLTVVRAHAGRNELLVCESWVNPGDPIVGLDGGPPDWLGEVTVGAEDLASAKRILAELIARIDYSFIQTEPISIRS